MPKNDFWDISPLVTSDFPTWPFSQSLKPGIVTYNASDSSSFPLGTRTLALKIRRQY